MADVVIKKVEEDASQRLVAPCCHSTSTNQVK